MKTLIYDLDGTVIDSSHRKLAKADGTLDLDHWIENCTPQKIRQDKLLPLAHTMRAQIRNGSNVAICTSRVMGEADFAFLKLWGIFCNVILHRGLNDKRRDGEYKVSKLAGYFTQQELKNAIMFDDAVEVRTSVRPLGVLVFDPEPINRRLAK